MRDADELFDRFVRRELTSAEMSIAEREAVHLRVLSEALDMPLFEFKCVKCGRVVEKLYRSYAAMQQETAWQCELPCTGFLERQTSAPSFKITGFSQQTGYASEQTRVQHHGNGIRTEVKGNFEAFDRLA